VATATRLEKTWSNYPELDMSMISLILRTSILIMTYPAIEKSSAVAQVEAVINGAGIGLLHDFRVTKGQDS
jgi:hypothetical protein